MIYVYGPRMSADEWAAEQHYVGDATGQQGEGIWWIHIDSFAKISERPPVRGDRFVMLYEEHMFGYPRRQIRREIREIFARYGIKEQSL